MFSEFWSSLSKDARIQFSQKVGTSYGYINKQLVYKKRQPSIKMLNAMVCASNGVLTHKSLVDFFSSSFEEKEYSNSSN